jgi:DNA-binding NarL/FixJ family response regulator
LRNILVLISHPTRILIAESHEMVRLSLGALIDPCDDLITVGAAHDGYEVLRLCAELRPDVLLIGLHLKGLDGLHVVRRLRENLGRLYIIMVCGLLTEQHERMALDAGANRCLTQEASAADILAAIRGVVAHS